MGSRQPQPDAAGRHAMSQMTDAPAGGADEDRASLRSNGRTPTGGAVKETLGALRTFRESIRRAAERSPLSPGARGSKVTPKADGDEPGSTSSPAPPSPSLSSGSPVVSTLRSIGGLFQVKGDDEAPPQKDKPLMRSKTDPNMAGLGDSIFKKGASIRRSLKFGSKKDKDKTPRQDQFPPVAEGEVKVREVKEAQEVEKEEEEEEVEMEETYTLPEIPHTPLSVMQINKLIEMEVLEEAHLNLLALRQEFQRELEHCGEDSPVELAKKEKDLNLLYGDLRTKLGAIVRDSNSLPARNKGLLVLVARIIQEEEKRAGEPGGLPGSWMEAWREAVGEGVKAKVESVHLEQCDQGTSWLAVHLGLLGKAIVDDLEKVRSDLRWSYPPSFKVFGTYVKSYHGAVRQHLKKLEQQVAELKDQYALLDWIINRYKSERIMGSPSLQPNMADESADLQLEDDFLRRLKEKYCRRVTDDMRTSLDRVIELENEELWTGRRSPEREENFLESDFHMDIWTKVKGNVLNSGRIDAELEQKVISSCLRELTDFPKRFETEFGRHCFALRPESLLAKYRIAYINSFTSLQQHMDGYWEACPDQVEAFRREVRWLIARLMQGLEDSFKDDVKPYLRRMMTRKWLTNDDDFKQLYGRTEQLSQHCALMRPPHAQELASRLHHHVVKEYVGQLMRNVYSCKNQKHERAASKIRLQSRKLSELFEDMNSTHEWLFSVGDDLSNIIGQKNKTDIKNHLPPLVEHHPDFSRKHLAAVLSFRGLLRGREHQLILQRLSELRKTSQPAAAASDRSRALFADMAVTANTDCLSGLPFSCFDFLLPDS